MPVAQLVAAAEAQLAVAEVVATPAAAAHQMPALVAAADNRAAEAVAAKLAACRDLPGPREHPADQDDQGNQARPAFQGTQESHRHNLASR